MSLAPLRRSLGWAEWWPALRAGLWALGLFALGMLAVRLYALPIRTVLDEHALAGMLIFFVTSAVAVLLPMLTNLPLMPPAVLAWGPWQAAALLLAGWVTGAALSFTLGRHARELIITRFPAVMRHADIDRLIHPRHRLVSLVMLRMTFPVDVLSYALGLFSRSTTLGQNMLSTAIGGAPFAVLFALFPLLQARQQAGLLIGSTAAFGVYAAWVLQRRPA
jgi:uncharacterized membrane protein YdjX (TVP38/TMEM64 family)